MDSSRFLLPVFSLNSSYFIHCLIYPLVLVYWTKFTFWDAQTDDFLVPSELFEGVRWCDCLLSQLTDSINEEVFAQNPNLKVVANYAVGFNNIDVAVR